MVKPSICDDLHFIAHSVSCSLNSMLSLSVFIIPLVLQYKTLVHSLTIISPKRGLATIYSQLNQNKLAQLFSSRPNFSFVLAYL